MSLLEVTLAMSMLAVLTVGSAGMVKGAQSLSKRSEQKMSMQQDVAFAFKRFEYYMLERRFGVNLGYQIQFTPVSANAFNVVLTTIDSSDPLDASKTWQLEASYSRANTGATAGYNYVRIHNLAEQIMVNGFQPWARLKDYNRSGTVDAADVALRDACLSDFTRCISPKCGGNTVRMSFTPVADSSTDCIEESIFPMIEISSQQDMAYFSFRPVRENSRNTAGRHVLPGVTKAVPLFRSEEV